MRLDGQNRGCPRQPGNGRTGFQPVSAHGREARATKSSITYFGRQNSLGGDAGLTSKPPRRNSEALTPRFLSSFSHTEFPWTTILSGEAAFLSKVRRPIPTTQQSSHRRATLARKSAYWGVSRNTSMYLSGSARTAGSRLST